MTNNLSNLALCIATFAALGNAEKECFLAAVKEVPSQSKEKEARKPRAAKLIHQILKEAKTAMSKKQLIAAYARASKVRSWSKINERTVSVYISKYANVLWQGQRSSSQGKRGAPPVIYTAI